jgi:hypothetical protein
MLIFVKSQSWSVTGVNGQANKYPDLQPGDEAGNRFMSRQRRFDRGWAIGYS